MSRNFRLEIYPVPSFISLIHFQTSLTLLSTLGFVIRTAFVVFSAGIGSERLSAVRTRKCHIKKLWHYLSRRTAVFFWLSRSLPRRHPARATRLFVIVEWLGIGRPPDRKHNGEMGQVATPRSIVAKVCSMGGENRKGQSHFSCVMASYEEE